MSDLQKDVKTVVTSSTTAPPNSSKSALWERFEKAASQCESRIPDIQRYIDASEQRYQSLLSRAEKQTWEFAMSDCNAAEHELTQARKNLQWVNRKIQLIRECQKMLNSNDCTPKDIDSAMSFLKQIEIDGKC
jgi:chromosome segregation ATPase